MRRPITAALFAATIICLAKGSLAATITVHWPDANCLVFVDVVGEIKPGDDDTFAREVEKIATLPDEALTDSTPAVPGTKFYPVVPISKLEKASKVIVTLIGPGGSLTGLRIGELIKAKGMSTFVPEDRKCGSVCALIWLAGTPRPIGEKNVRIGFHGAYIANGEVTGPGNALVGSYLTKLGFSDAAIIGM